jgi:hypothetical protein
MLQTRSACMHASLFWSLGHISKPLQRTGLPHGLPSKASGAGSAALWRIATASPCLAHCKGASLAGTLPEQVLAHCSEYTPPLTYGDAAHAAAVPRDDAHAAAPLVAALQQAQRPRRHRAHYNLQPRRRSPLPSSFCLAPRAQHLVVHPVALAPRSRVLRAGAACARGLPVQAASNARAPQCACLIPWSMSNMRMRMPDHMALGMGSGGCRDALRCLLRPIP